MGCNIGGGFTAGLWVGSLSRGGCCWTKLALILTYQVIWWNGLVIPSVYVGEGYVHRVPEVSLLKSLAFHVLIIVAAMLRST